MTGKGAMAKVQKAKNIFDHHLPSQYLSISVDPYPADHDYCRF